MFSTKEIKIKLECVTGYVGRLPGTFVKRSRKKKNAQGLERAERASYIRLAGFCEAPL